MDSPTRIKRPSKRWSLSFNVNKKRENIKPNNVKVDASDNKQKCVPRLLSAAFCFESNGSAYNSPKSMEMQASSLIIVSDDENTVQSLSKCEFDPPARKYTTRTTAGKQCAGGTSGRTSSVAKTALNKRNNKVRQKIPAKANIKSLTNKYFDESQKRITNFFNNVENGDSMGYCRILRESVMPSIITGDIEIERYLHVSLEEGDEQPNIFPNKRQLPIPSPSYEIEEKICSIKTMEQIEHVESLCYDPVRDDWNMERVQIPIEIVDSYNDGTTCESRSKSCDPRKLEQSSCTRNKNISKQKPNSKTVCPNYKVIAGTNFAVDAFRYGNIAGITHYFLTHFHADHYIGLKKGFCKPLIMSPITARLVKIFLNVSTDFFVSIKLHEAFIIDGVEITALDANHCPGAVMFLFRLPDGTIILHTGDFRASPEMEEYPELWNVAIDCIYLDTTYLSSKYAFKSQWESVCDAREIVETYLEKHSGTKVLVVCGSYLIGKETVWLELALSLNMKVWTEPNRWKALKAIADPNQLSVLVADPMVADIHVLAMKKLTYCELNQYINEFPDRYDSVIGIRPSGWEKNTKPQYRGRINIVGVEYSEHSSYDELERFVRYLRPREVISTVPYCNSNQNRTPTVPTSWYQGTIRPRRKEFQQSIDQFLKSTEKIKGRLLRFSSRSKNNDQCKIECAPNS